MNMITGILRSKSTTITGTSTSSTNAINIKLEITFPKKKASLAMGDNNVPVNPPLSTSKAKVLERPRIPPKESATQRIPGATIATVRGVGSNAMLNTTIDSKENTKTETTTSLDRASRSKSFQAMIKICVK